MLFDEKKRKKTTETIHLAFFKREKTILSTSLNSLLSYVDFNGIVKESKDNITIEEAYKIFEKKYVPRKKEFIAIKNGVKLFEKIKDTRRYKDIKRISCK